MNQEFKREIILENYQNPKNRGLILDESYIHQNMNSESCIDEIDLMVKLENNKIKDIKFDGEACAICTSSTSIMIQELLDKDINDAKDVIDNFKRMINEEEFDSEKIGQAIVYEDIKMQPNRKNCALLSWKGIEKIIK